MVTCFHDVGIYKNPKITEHFEINDIYILRNDQALFESYDETNNLTNKTDESVEDFLTQASLLSPIDNNKYIQYDEDEHKSFNNEEMSYNDMMSVASKLHNALQRN